MPSQYDHAIYRMSRARKWQARFMWAGLLSPLVTFFHPGWLLPVWCICGFGAGAAHLLRIHYRNKAQEYEDEH